MEEQREIINETTINWRNFRLSQLEKQTDDVLVMGFKVSPDMFG